MPGKINDARNLLEEMPIREIGEINKGGWESQELQCKSDPEEGQEEGRKKGKSEGRKFGWKHPMPLCNSKASLTRLFRFSQSRVRGLSYLPGMGLP